MVDANIFIAIPPAKISSHFISLPSGCDGVTLYARQARARKGG